MRIEIPTLKVINLQVLDDNNNVVDILSYSKIIKEINDNIDIVFRPSIYNFHLDSKEDCQISLTTPSFFYIDNERYETYHTNMKDEWLNFNKLFLEELSKYHKFIIEIDKEYFNKPPFYHTIAFIEKIVEYSNEEYEYIRTRYEIPKESILLLEGVNLHTINEKDYVTTKGFFTYQSYKFLDSKKDLEFKKEKLLNQIKEIDLRYELAIEL